MSCFNALSPDIEPTATGHISEQIDMINDIINNGYAYEVNGSVYFNVKKYIDDGYDYGELSGRNTDDLIAGSKSLTDNRIKNLTRLCIMEKSGS